MAKKKSTSEKPEEAPEQDDGLLTAYTVLDEQLRRLLKAEQNNWTGTVDRRSLRNIADQIRKELNDGESN